MTKQDEASPPPPRDLTAEEITAVGGGFNPQPDPPGRQARLRD